MVRVPVSSLASGERSLDDEASHYLLRVHRLVQGARFVAFDPARAVEAEGELLGQAGRTALVRFGPLRSARVVATCAITWIHALCKGDKLDAIVQDATELGATRIVLARSERSVVRVDDSKSAAKLARWTKIAREAARQSGRADPPEVTGPFAWREALTGVSPNAARFCLDTGDASPLGPLLLAALSQGDALAFAAGPEGGLTPEELAAAEQAGFQRVSLGPFVLRTETVPAATLGAVRVLAGSSDSPPSLG